MFDLVVSTSWGGVTDAFVWPCHTFSHIYLQVSAKSQGAHKREIFREFCNTLIRGTQIKVASRVWGKCITYFCLVSRLPSCMDQGAFTWHLSLPVPSQLCIDSGRVLGQNFHRKTFCLFYHCRLVHLSPVLMKIFAHLKTEKLKNQGSCWPVQENMKRREDYKVIKYIWKILAWELHS